MLSNIIYKFIIHINSDFELLTINSEMYVQKYQKKIKTYRQLHKT